jgi:hypothetical protein
VPLDYVAAYTWYSVAAAGGEQHSAKRLKVLEHVMPPQQLRAAQGQAAERRQHGGQTAPQEGVSSLSLLPRD